MVNAHSVEWNNQRLEEIDGKVGGKQWLGGISDTDHHDSKHHQ